MRKMVRQALEYIRNTNGGATKANFVEDFDPVGELLWDDLQDPTPLATISNGKVFLTETGNAALNDK